MGKRKEIWQLEGVTPLDFFLLMSLEMDLGVFRVHCTTKPLEL